jgi:excinuclease ABC subunit C
MLSQNNNKKQYLAHILQNIPHKPGVYKMKDGQGNIIYVGKAIDLKNRVSNYFNNSPKETRTEKMVENIRDIDYTVVDSDLEALILESNLIKELRPKYNILLKDDKNYVYLKITVNELYPRIYIVRKVAKDKAKYYGPKTAAYKLINTLKLLKRIFPFRNCQLAMDFSVHGQSKYKNMSPAQLEYHRKHCIGPCITSVTPEEYRKTINQVIAFFEGKHEGIIRQIKEDMIKAAQEKKFEVAASIRDKLKAIEDITEQQRVSDPNLRDLDIINYFPQDDNIYFNLFQIRGGKLINQENFIFKATNENGTAAAEDPDALESFLEQYYEKATDIPPEILVPHTIEEQGTMEEWLTEMKGQKVAIKIPERGKKNHLLDLSYENAKSYARQSMIKWQGAAKDTREKALKELQNILKLPEPPLRLECYDISHLGGTDTVGSMVVFEHGFPKKEYYRHFKLHQQAPDDYASMQEILTRRLKYLKPALEAKDLNIRNPKKEELLLIAKELKAKKLPVKTFFAIEKDDKYAGFVQIFMTADKKALIEKMHGAQQQDFSFLIRKTAEKLKVKRIYVECDNKDKICLEEAGCQSIAKIPDTIPKRKGKTVIVYDKNNNIQDKSFLKTPDLMIIDGGKGQLGIAAATLKKYGLKLPLISIAKKEEEIFLPGNPISIQLAKNDPVLHLIQHIRDESHRFAITFQRSLRFKTTTTSFLDQIYGLGPQLKKRLLQHFKSPENIRNATEAEIAKIAGPKLAAKIKGLK